MKKLNKKGVFPILGILIVLLIAYVAYNAFKLMEATPDTSSTIYPNYIAALASSQGCNEYCYVVSANTYGVDGLFCGVQFHDIMTCVQPAVAYGSDYCFASSVAGSAVSAQMCGGYTQEGKSWYNQILSKWWLAALLIFAAYFVISKKLWKKVWR